MDTRELNKIAGAVIAALLLMFGSATFIDIQMSHKRLAKPGYELPVETTTAAESSQTSAAAGLNFEEIASLLQNASADSGQAAFKRCSTCHTPDKGGRNMTGPNLWGIVGRPKGSQEGFNYSAALKEKGGEWGYEELANFIHNPRSYIPGNKMAFAGIRDNGEIADLLAYLRTLSDNPPPLPSN
ncbi:MAG TPA: cytochrome c family protein [Hyphomicrobiaceae bacterium]|nr:cytochrome c family protein [Hyphomicrobiaceae bacterium]